MALVYGSEGWGSSPSEHAPPSAPVNGPAQADPPVLLIVLARIKNDEHNIWQLVAGTRQNAVS
jgi:hypothetical protein